MRIQTIKIKRYMSILTILLAFPSVTCYAEITNTNIKAYSNTMYQAANTQDLQKISSLISDNVIISVNRNGLVGTMGKQSYLKKLQDNWSTTTNYQYAIDIKDVVFMGDNAKAKITTTEVFVKNGIKIKQVTEAKATLTENNNKAILLKAVSEVIIK